MKLCVTRKDHYIGGREAGAMSTGAEQIHEYPWVPEVFARVRRSSAAEMFRSRSTLLSHERRSDLTSS